MSIIFPSELVVFSVYIIWIITIRIGEQCIIICHAIPVKTHSIPDNGIEIIPMSS